MAKAKEEHPLRVLMKQRGLDITEASKRFGISTRQLVKYLSGSLSIPPYIERMIDLGAIGRKRRMSPLTILVKQWETQYCKRKNIRSGGKRTAASVVAPARTVRKTASIL